MLRGSLVAIVTPMTADGSLDWPAWDRLLDFHVSEGTDGIVIGGTTGEAPALALEEVEELTRRALLRCSGKLKLIVGAGTHATSSTVVRTRALSRLGPDAVMLVTPYYNKPPQEGLFRHFMAAADVSAVPIVLYNVPSRTAVDLLPATVSRLAHHPRIVAIKDASAAPHALQDSRCCPGTMRRPSSGSAPVRTASSRCRPTSHPGACTRPVRRRSKAMSRRRAPSMPSCSPCTRIFSSRPIPLQ